MNGLRLLLCGVVCLCLVSMSAAAEPAWKAGFASVKVTPEKPVYLAGYASRNRPFEEVVSDLFVKALALEDAEGHRAVLITSDVIGYRAEFADPICAEIQKRTGLERSQILLNSSHTHTGPLLTLDPTPKARNMTAEQAADSVAYTKTLMQHTIDVAVAALGKLNPAQLQHGWGAAHFVMNRREPTERGVRLGVNPKGLADRSVPVLRIDDAKGALVGVVFGAACHNTTLGGRDYFVCGDYAGFAQTHIQKKFPQAQAMFMIGCGGSANPYPRGGLENSRAHGKELGTEVCRVLETKLKPVDGALTTAFDRVALPLQPAPSREEIDRLAAGSGGWQPWVAKQMIEILATRKALPTHYECPVAVWQFGDDLTLVGLSGEVVVDYVPLIADALGPLNLWTAAYCNDVWGYVPSRKVLAEGGYETRGVIYNGIGFVAPEAERVLVEKVKELAKRAGRK